MENKTDNKCKHTKEDGTQCGAYAMADTEFCYLHNPAISDEEKKLAQVKGGENRALMIDEPLPVMRLETPSDAVMLLADTINRVRTGTLDPRIANTIGYLAGHLLKAFEVAQLKDKIEVIERLVVEKRTHY